MRPKGLNTTLQKEMNCMLGQMFGVMEKIGTHEAVVGGRVVLGVVISKIGHPRLPVDKELPLVGPVLDPIKLHVDGLGSFLFDGVVCKTLSSGVVDLHGGGRLWMAHFLKRCADGDGLLPIGVGGGTFRFCSGSHDGFDDLREGVDGALWCWRCFWLLVGGWGPITEKEMSTGTTAGLGLGQVAAVAVDVENHATCGVKDSGSTIGVCVVE